MTTGTLVTGLTAASRTGNGRSGIVQWNNLGGVNSPIVGSFPAQDTAIMDPPTWFTAIPATMSVDGRLPLAGFFLGRPLGPRRAVGVGAGVGRDRARHVDSRDARLAVFGDEPALPGRSGAGVDDAGSAAYWADK